MMRRWRNTCLANGQLVLHAQPLPGILKVNCHLDILIRLNPQICTAKIEDRAPNCSFVSLLHTKETEIARLHCSYGKRGDLLSGGAVAAEQIELFGDIA